RGQPHRRRSAIAWRETLSNRAAPSASLGMGPPAWLQSTQPTRASTERDRCRRRLDVLLLSADSLAYRARTVRCLEETHDVECDSESPGVSQATLALSARRLRLAWRGEGRVCRRFGLVALLESRPSHAPQRCGQRSARTTRFRLWIKRQGRECLGDD